MSNFNTRNFLKADAQQVDQIKQNLDASINAKDKLKEQTTRDLLDVFLTTENAVHIDNAAENIKSNREKQEHTDSKVQVISDIDSDITFKGKKLLKKDHPEIYAQYNTILKDSTLSEAEKTEKLAFLDRLIASRSSLLTANNSLMYTFKRRIYFSTAASRNTIFSELDKVEPFKGKIEVKNQELSGEIHFIIKWKDEISKRVHKPKPKKPTPTPKPTKPDSQDIIDIDTDSTSAWGNSTATAKVDNSHSGNSKIWNITHTVEVNNDALAEALVKINEQNQKTMEMLIKALTESKNTTHHWPHYWPGVVPYYGPISPSFYTTFKDNDIFKQFMAMMQQQQQQSQININWWGNNWTNEANIMLMMKEMFENMKLELKNEINEKYQDIDVRLKKSYKKIKKLINDIDVNTFDPEEIRKIIQEELNLFKTGVMKEIKEEIKKIKLSSEEDLKKLEEKIDTGFSDMKNEFTTLKDHVNERFDALDKQLKNIEGKIENINKELELINGKLKLMGEDIDILKKQQKALLEELKKLHEEHDKIMDELANIKKMIEDCCKKGKLDDDDDDNLNFHEIKQEAVISNVTEISREEAEKIAENELREKYGNMSWLNPKRYRYFYAREYLTKNRAQKIMNADGRKGLNRDEKFTAAADRHGLEYANDLDNIESILEITQDTYPQTHYKINELAENFMGAPDYKATMSKDEFHQKFQEIIEKKDPYDHDVKPSLKKVMEKNNMQKLSSNIFNQVDSFRANKELVHKMVDYLDTVRPDDVAFQNYCRPLIQNYIKDYASMPAFMKRFEDETGIKLSLDSTMYKNMMAHQCALSIIQADTLNLNVKLINRGRAAYKVDQEHWKLTKIGKWMDRPFAKWIDTSEWGLGRFGKNTASILTKIAAQAGPVAGLGMLWGSLVGGPLGWALGVWIGVSLKTLFAKFAHTTKEHEGHLRDQARNFTATQEYRKRMFEAVNNWEYKRYHRIVPNRKGIEYRNFLRYLRTSHDELSNTQTETTAIMQFAQKADQLTAPEKQKLLQHVGEALARLDLYQQTGQNFFGSDQEVLSEKEMRDLKKAVMLGVARLDTTLNSIKHETHYQKTKPILEGQYNQARASFKKMKRNLAWKGAVKTWVIAGWMSYTISALANTFSKGEVISWTKNVEHSLNTKWNWEPAQDIESKFIKWNVDLPLKTAISDPDYASGNFEVVAGVDELAYHNVAGAKADLAAKVPAVKHYIKTHFSGTNQKMLLDALDPKVLSKIQSDALSHWVDEGNSFLLSSRYVEGIEEIAHAHVDAGKTGSPIVNISSKIIHQPSVTHTTGNLDFRTMGVNMNYTTTETWNEFIKTHYDIMPTDWIDNTFKMGNEQEKNAPTS